MANLWKLREAKDWASDWRRHYGEKEAPEKYASLVQKRAKELRALLDSAKDRWIQNAGMPSKREATLAVRWLEREAKRAEKSLTAR